MAMSIEVVWQNPIVLGVSPKGGFVTLNLWDEDNIPQESGVYFFASARKDRGKKSAKLTPLYIGEGGNIRKRIKDHLDILSFVKHLKFESPPGNKVVVVGIITPQKGQSPAKARKIVEDALISKVVSSHNADYLLNERGTKKQQHLISLKGNRATTDNRLFGKSLAVLVSKKK